jgi:hypothetical protein
MDSLAVCCMGLKLRYNLFYNTTAAAVYGAYVSFFEERDRPLRPTGNERHRIDFHHTHNGWVVVALDAGWEWEERREVQLLVSRRLLCPGFLAFVYDGDYWGYEFFDHGEPLDHFVQESTGQPIGFPDEDCRGKAEVVAEHLPVLRAADIAPYLMQKHDWVIAEGADVPARPGDEFCRFDECAVLDFLRMLGVHVSLQAGYVGVESPVYRSVFTVSQDGRD